MKRVDYGIESFTNDPQSIPSCREMSHVPSVNVTPVAHDVSQDTPEIRKYKKRFNSEILCAALWGVNLLIGTENGLMLLDRSGQGKVYQLISRRRFQQMEVLEGQNILVTISGKRIIKYDFNRMYLILDCIQARRTGCGSTTSLGSSRRF